MRGFTLNLKNNINSDSINKYVTNPNSCKQITVVNPCKICRDIHTRKLYNLDGNKSYQMVYTQCQFHL